MEKRDFLDLVFSELDYALDIIVNSKNTDVDIDTSMNDKSRERSIRVMRVNHMGEVCAQALYRGQAITTKDKNIKKELYKMCNEEREHLDLCNERLAELKGKTSLANPGWYASSFALGCIAGITSKKWGLGFIEETEKQVTSHLNEYIDKLPTEDSISKDILIRIKEDEIQHKKSAKKIGSKELPSQIKKGMNILSNLMKGISYRI